MMKNLQLSVFSLFFVITLTIMACNSQPASNVTSLPVPTTDPLSAVEQAILAANDQDYDRANQLLDVSSVTQDSDFETAVEYWDWLTSSQRVTDIDINEEEAQGETKRLFITLQNENYPTRNTGFWIQWQDDRWVAFNTE